MTSADVKENFKIIEQRSHPHPVVLIDHRNSYSLAFSAQEILRKSDFSLAVAVLVNGITRIRLAQTVVDVMRIKARCEIFTDEAKAFRWLKKVSNIENDQFTQ